MAVATVSTRGDRLGPPLQASMRLSPYREEKEEKPVSYQIECCSAIGHAPL